VLKATGLPKTGATVKLSGQTITFTSGSTTYKLVAPDGVIVFSAAATTATTTFVANEWTTTVPLKIARNVFVSGLGFRVPADLPASLKNVTWQGVFSSDQHGVSVTWQWAAAVYNPFSALNALLGVKPVDDNKTSTYTNADHSGTPENYKSSLLPGGAGGGGTDCTGALSATVKASPLYLGATPISGWYASN
jgi:hypothetical protein